MKALRKKAGGKEGKGHTIYGPILFYGLIRNQKIMFFRCHHSGYISISSDSFAAPAKDADDAGCKEHSYDASEKDSIEDSCSAY